MECHGILSDFVEEYQTPEQYVQSRIDLLKQASQNYIVPRWHKQQNYVEVWIEKQALADTFSSFLKGRDVRIVVSRGYSGLRKLYEASKGQGREIHILCFGDFDPSGDNMDDHLDNAILVWRT